MPPFGGIFRRVIRLNQMSNSNNSDAAKLAGAAAGGYIGMETIGGIGVTLLGGAFGIPALVVGIVGAGIGMAVADAVTKDM